jgi:hypothetical protein
MVALMGSQVSGGLFQEVGIVVEQAHAAVTFPAQKAPYPFGLVAVINVEVTVAAGR